MTDPYFDQAAYYNTYSQDASAGYYDENGQWYYYETSEQAHQYTDQNYANSQQQYQQQYQQYPETNGSSGYQPAPQDWSQANTYPQPEKKRTSINPRQIPRHIRYPPSETEPTGEMPEYCTSSEAHPPSPLDDCRIVDDGNASSRYIRLTAYQLPSSSEMVETTRLSIGAIITPLATPGPGEYAVPVVDMGEGGPIRCSRCQAYLNSFCSFTDNGQRFVCNLCDMSTPVPHWYACNVDGNGIRRDRYERSELHLGSVEYIAPPGYITRPIQDPCYLFVLDVSYSAFSTGLVELTIRSVQTSINSMVDCPRVRIGIITYSSAVHIYRNKGSGLDPAIMIVASHDDVFLPIPGDQILLRPSAPEERQVLERILEKIPALHEPSRSVSTAFGAVTHIAVETLSSTGGKVLMVQSCLPRVHLGALDDRDDPSLYSTPKEKDLLKPQDSFYQLQATECAEHSISVDLFVCANTYVDMATVGVLPSMTGGQLFYYPDFNSIKDGYSLESDIIQATTRETGFEGVMIIRTSAGLRVADHFGNFFRRHSSEIELPAIDCAKSVAVRLEHESPLPDKSYAYIQAALLYTTFHGERRIRVHTFRAPVTSSIANVFRNADLYSIVNLSIRQAALQCIEQGVSSTRASLQQAVIDVLYTYRKECGSSSSSGQLILPESLKLLPLYTLGLMKCPVLHDCIRADHRVFVLTAVQAMSVSEALAFCLPSLYAIHTLPDADMCFASEDPSLYPMKLPEYELVSREYMEDHGIYLLDSGQSIYLFFGSKADPQLVYQLMGVEDVSAYDPNDLGVYPTEDPAALATRVYNLIERIRYGRSSYSPLRIVHDRSPFLAEFNGSLVESSMSPPAGSKMSESDTELMSYSDFLCNVHRRIQDKFI